MTAESNADRRGSGEIVAWCARTDAELKGIRSDLGELRDEVRRLARAQETCIQKRSRELEALRTRAERLEGAMALLKWAAGTLVATALMTVCTIIIYLIVGANR
jgi:hypothetical protein